MSQEERDLLIRMDEKLSNLIVKTSQLAENFEKHAVDDKKQFSILFKFMWGISGAFAFILIVLKLIN